MTQDARLKTQDSGLKTQDSGLRTQDSGLRTQDSTNKYDSLIIGSGPGGYVAAIRCAQLGMKTAIVEKYGTLGGACLNVGCIPSKALLDSSEYYYLAKHRFNALGIIVDHLKADLKKMVDRKDEVVRQNVVGINYLMRKNKIDVYHGHASFMDKNRVEVQSSGDEIELAASNIIIATGSKPIVPESFNFDKKRVISSTEALDLKELPQSLIIVGAGVIGLELGSVFARLGTSVQIVEYMDQILPGMDKDCAKELHKTLEKLGIEFHMGQIVKSAKPFKTKVKVELQSRDSGGSNIMDSEYCLVAIGRRPYTDRLGLDNVNISTDEKGRIMVNERLQTSSDHIYAIGDVIRGAMLAHKAEDEGVFVAETIAGQKPHINYNLIPNVVYTWPEMAGVGSTEEELKKAGIAYKTGKFPFKALGRARASMDIEGLVKIIADKKTDEVLGVHIVGARAADLIMEAASLMEFRASAEDIARMCHPHPTYSEAIKEAALSATANRSIHV